VRGEGGGGGGVCEGVRGGSLQGRGGREAGGRRVPLLGEGTVAWEPPDEKEFCVASGDGWPLTSAFAGKES